MTATVLLRRSILFFPADHPERFAKAIATGADAVCADLEDGVPLQSKEVGRQQAFERILKEARRGAEVILRINDPKGELGRRDLQTLCEGDVSPDTVMIPKVTSAAEVVWVAGLLEHRHPDVRLLPMVETVRALANVEEIAAASPRISALQFGGVDLSIELGCAVEWDALLVARSRIVHAAALAGIGSIDVPFLDVSDAAGLAREAAAVRRLGFTGKAAIHPVHIPAIHGAFSPTAAEVERATTIMQAFERSQGGAVLGEGKMIDRPVMEAARRTLARADLIRSKLQSRVSTGAEGAS